MERSEAVLGLSAAGHLHVPARGCPRTKPKASSTDAGFPLDESGSLPPNASKGTKIPGR